MTIDQIYAIAILALCAVVVIVAVLTKPKD